MGKTTAILLISILIFNMNTGGQTLFIESLHKELPGLEFQEGWVMPDTSSLFLDEGLYDFINGGADLYFEYGIHGVLSMVVTNDSLEVNIECYEMEDDAGAFGIFSVQRGQEGKTVDIGELAVAYESYLDIWKDKLFIRIFLKDGIKEPEVCQSWGRWIAEKVAGRGQVPEIVTLVDSAGIDVSNAKYFRGIIALGNLYSFGYGIISGFYEGLVSENTDRKVFVFRYKDAESCYEWYQSARGKIQGGQRYNGFAEQADGFTVTDSEQQTLSFFRTDEAILVIRGDTWEQSEVIFHSLKNIFK
ncbi:MAG: hypothetical protein JW861_00055 [Bacteroidales bacterium]|nr:hypothetical protein [Bacteroidales bacterium]